jgi:hypothetical protein
VELELGESDLDLVQDLGGILAIEDIQETEDIIEVDITEQHKQAAHQLFPGISYVQKSKYLL